MIGRVAKVGSVALESDIAGLIAGFIAAIFKEPKCRKCSNYASRVNDNGVREISTNIDDDSIKPTIPPLSTAGTFQL